MQLQKERARAAREVDTYMGADETVYHQLDTAMLQNLQAMTERPLPTQR